MNKTGLFYKEFKGALGNGVWRAVLVIKGGHRSGDAQVRPCNALLKTSMFSKTPERCPPLTTSTTHIMFLTLGVEEPEQLCSVDHAVVLLLILLFRPK